MTRASSGLDDVGPPTPGSDYESDHEVPPGVTRSSTPGTFEPSVPAIHNHPIESTLEIYPEAEGVGYQASPKSLVPIFWRV